MQYCIKWILLHGICHAGAIFLFGINIEAEVRILATRWGESPTKQLRVEALQFNRGAAYIIYVYTLRSKLPSFVCPMLT